MASGKLAFQPEAERFYAEGYWRSGDLWEDVAARAQEHPDRVAMVLGDRRVRYDELCRAAVGVSTGSPTPACSPARSSSCSAGTPSRPSSRCSGACTAVSCSRRCRRCSTPPSCRRSSVRRAREASSRSAATRRSRSAARSRTRCRWCSSCARTTSTRPRRPICRPTGRARRRRSRDGAPLVGHDVGAQGRRPLEQHPPLRRRGRVPPVGPHRRRHLPDRGRVRLRRRPGLRLLPVLFNGATGVLLNRWNAEDALRLIEEHRCTYVLAMPTHAADMIRGRADGPGPLLDARARRSRTHARAAGRHAPRLRHAAARRLRALGGARACRPRARRPGGQDPEHGGPALRRHGDPDRRQGRATAGAGQGRLGGRQRPEPLPRASSTTTSSRASR